jgi:hypothetical protein
MEVLWETQMKEVMVLVMVMTWKRDRLTMTITRDLVDLVTIKRCKTMGRLQLVADLLAVAESTTRVMTTISTRIKTLGKLLFHHSNQTVKIWTK